MCPVRQYIMAMTAWDVWNVSVMIMEMKLSGTAIQLEGSLKRSATETGCIQPMNMIQMIISSGLHSRTRRALFSPISGMSMT